MSSVFDVRCDFTRERFEHAPDISSENAVTGGIWMDADSTNNRWIKKK